MMNKQVIDVPKKHFVHSAYARKDTTDAYAFKEVVMDNCYHLPESGLGVCVDIGGHIGSFCYAALERGATKVYTYEPDPRNFAQLELNLAVHPRGDAVMATNAAVWRSDRPGELLPMSAFGYGTVTNPAGGGVAIAGNADAFLVPSISFREVIDRVPEDVEIDYLKIDCEGSEFGIILTAPPGTLERCKQIGMETHPKAFLRGSAVPLGFGRLSEQTLAKALEKRGFRVTIEQQESLPDMPMLFATRK